MEDNQILTTQTITSNNNQISDLVQIEKPFNNYHQLAVYYKNLAPNYVEADYIKNRLINEHILKIKTSNETLIDLAQLAYCDEAVAEQIFTRYHQLLEKDGNDPTNISGAIVVLCDALQARQYGKPDEGKIINLLRVLAQKVEQIQETIGKPDTLSILRLLSAINALLNTLLLRAINTDDQVAMGTKPHKDLEKCIKNLSKNLHKNKANQPWLYFLSQRAIENIQAIQIIKTTVEKREDRITALKNAGKVTGALIGIAGAVSATVVTLGASSPITLAAIIGFGTTLVGAAQKNYDIVKSVKGAHDRLSQHKASSLDCFQLMMNSHSGESNYCLDWQSEVESVFNSVVDCLGSVSDNKSDMEKISIVYFLTVLLMNTNNIPKTALTRLHDKLAELYKNSQKMSHVQTFILESFGQLHEATKEPNIIPKLTIGNYKSILLGAVPTKPNELKTYKERHDLLAKQLQVVSGNKLKLGRTLKPVEHNLLRNAWFQWYKNDEVLSNAQDVLQRIQEKYQRGSMNERKYNKKLTLLRDDLNRPSVIFALEDDKSTSTWGRECYKKIIDQLDRLGIEPTLKVDHKANWEIYGTLVNGDLNEFKAVEADNETLEGMGDRAEKLILELHKQILEVKFKANVQSGNKEEVSKFMKELMERVNLKVGPKGNVVAGDANITIGLHILSNQISKIEPEQGSRTKPIAFWQPPFPKIELDNDTKVIFSELKQQECYFEIELKQNHGKPILRITAVSKGRQIGVTTKALIKELRNKLTETLEAYSLSFISNKEDSKELTWEVQGEFAVLQIVHAWLCQVANIEPELDNEEQASYQCNIV